MSWSRLGGVFMRRSLLFWIVVTAVVAGVGFAVDKAVADNTPPYNEPLIAYIGWGFFMVSGAAFLVLCAVALVRLARRSS